MARLLSCIGSLLYITLQWQISSGTTISENKTLQIGDKLTLASPSFPVCCTQDFKFLMKCTGISCGFNILFLDVDLPSTASLIIQGDPSDAAPVLARAQLKEGVWSRPSLIYKGREMSITLNVPYQRVYTEYSGVKLRVHAYSTITQSLMEADVTSDTQCGRATLTEYKGGEVKLTPKTGGAVLDCIWLLKKPSGASNLNAFVRFTYTSELHGILAVRNGSNSAAPPLFYFDTEDGSTPIMHGKEGFTSPNDLYVRMRKQLDGGSLTYVYGLFTRINNADQGEECTINGYAGFFCTYSEWCIPMLDRCDGVKHCPRAEDENNCDGFEPVTYNLPTTTTVKVTTSPTPASTTTSVPPTSTCRFGFRLCKDGSCVSGERCPGECDSLQKKCLDGSCVRRFLPCPGECHTWEKKCNDGTCVSILDRCPGECGTLQKKCPDGRCIPQNQYCSHCLSTQAYRCAEVCYDDYQKCDGDHDCVDGSDEENCGLKFKWYFLFIALGVGGMVIVLIMCARSKSRAADAGECYSFEKKCPDDSCVSNHKKCPGECSLWQKKCADGHCTSIGGRCPGECRSQEKKCPNGDCINTDRYCPSHTCPSYEPHRCGDQCYSDSEECDGYGQCEDGTDERDCSTFPWYIILIVLAVAVMIIMIMCARSKSREADETQAQTQCQQTSLSSGRNTRGPVIAGAQNTPYPTVSARSNSSAAATNNAPTVTTPLAQPSAPPSYTEAMDTAPYNPQPTAPMLAEVAPPPYEDIAATTLPSKNSTSPV